MHTYTTQSMRRHLSLDTLLHMKQIGENKQNNARSFKADCVISHRVQIHTISAKPIQKLYCTNEAMIGQNFWHSLVSCLKATNKSKEETKLTTQFSQLECHLILNPLLLYYLQSYPIHRERMLRPYVLFGRSEELTFIGQHISYKFDIHTHHTPKSWCDVTKMTDQTSECFSLASICKQDQTNILQLAGFSRPFLLLSCPRIQQPSPTKMAIKNGYRTRSNVWLTTPHNHTQGRDTCKLSRPVHVPKMSDSCTSNKRMRSSNSLIERPKALTLWKQASSYKRLK